MPIAEVDVENDPVVFRDEREKPRFLAGVRDVYRVTVLGKHPSHQGSNRPVVFGNENADRDYLGAVKQE